MIYKLPNNLDDELFQGNYTPQVSMLVKRYNFLGGANSVQARFDFENGSITDYPTSPNLSVIENDYSLSLNWTPDNFASSYHIYRSESPIEDISLMNPLGNVTETNFVDIVPQSKRLRLSLNMNFPEIDDPRAICKDVSNVGRWGNGDVEVGLDSLEDVPYIVGLARQALEVQLGEDE